MTSNAQDRLPLPNIFHDYNDGSSRIGDYASKPALLPSDFDAETYLEMHPDVAEAKIDAAVHYVYEGIREGRSYKTSEPT